MRILLLTSTTLMIAATTIAFSQSSDHVISTDGLQLLSKVSQNYEDAKSYHFEVVQERTTHNDLSRSWEKFILTAAEAPGGRYHYEGHSGEGSALRIADGTTVWAYHLDEHRYTKSPVASETSSQSRLITMTEYVPVQPEDLRKGLAEEGKHLKSATRLAGATLVVNVREIACSVIRIQSSDKKRVTPDYTFEKTFWIDRVHMTIVKTVEQAHPYLVSGASRIPLERETTTTYSVAELDGAVPDDLFTFVPPSDARLVQEFPDPTKSTGGSDLTGEDVPNLKLRSAD